MASTQTELQALLDSRVEACRAKDIDRLMSLYSPDIVYFDLVPPLQYTGSAAVRGNFLRMFDGFKSSIGQEIRGLHMSDHRWLITHEHISLPVDFESGRAAMDLVP